MNTPHVVMLPEPETPNIVGVNKRGMPCERGIVDYLCVLVQGEDNNVAAYLGIGPEDWVARNGDKVSLAEAAIHFPGLPENLTTRGMHYRGS